MIEFPSAFALTFGVVVLTYGLKMRKFWRREPHRSLVGALLLQVIAFAFWVATTWQVDLYDWTGIAHLPMVLASVMGLWAMLLFLQSLVCRLMVDVDTVMFRARSAVNAAVFVMIISVVAAQHRHAPRIDGMLADDPAVGWMLVYWVTAFTSTLVLEVCLIRLLLVMRRHGPSRPVADALVAACCFGCLSVVLLAARIVFGLALGFFLTAMTCGGVGFCGAMVMSWRRKRLQAVVVAGEGVVPPAYGFPAPGHR